MLHSVNLSARLSLPITLVTFELTIFCYISLRCFCLIIFCLIYFYSCKEVGGLNPPPPSPSVCAVPVKTSSSCKFLFRSMQSTKVLTVNSCFQCFLQALSGNSLILHQTQCANLPTSFPGSLIIPLPGDERPWERGCKFARVTRQMLYVARF